MADSKDNFPGFSREHFHHSFPLFLSPAEFQPAVRKAWKARHGRYVSEGMIRGMIHGYDSRQCNVPVVINSGCNPKVLPITAAVTPTKRLQTPGSGLKLPTKTGII